LYQKWELQFSGCSGGCGSGREYNYVALVVREQWWLWSDLGVLIRSGSNRVVAMVVVVMA